MSTSGVFLLALQVTTMLALLACGVFIGYSIAMLRAQESKAKARRACEGVVAEINAFLTWRNEDSQCADALAQVRSQFTTINESIGCGEPRFTKDGWLATEQMADRLKEWLVKRRRH